ncbi:hypothetical protein HYDPIDRAFT_109544 [Hydnomerulius pinastri MD-312]|nr:hypothetical protein HYDPIDRAFT_109544 [Hydnomerulius pinastri MD-312]
MGTEPRCGSTGLTETSRKHFAQRIALKEKIRRKIVCVDSEEESNKSTQARISFLKSADFNLSAVLVAVAVFFVFESQHTSTVLHCSLLALCPLCRFSCAFNDP